MIDLAYIIFLWLQQILNFTEICNVSVQILNFPQGQTKLQTINQIKAEM